METHETIHKSKKQIIINNFIGGIAWGLGATIGVTIFFTILGFILGKINWIPFIGDFVTKVNVYVSQKSLNLLQ